MAGAQASIAIVANARPAIAAFSDTGAAATDMGRTVADAGKHVDDLGEKFGDNASKSSQLAGGIGDLGGAISQLPGPLGAVGRGMELLGPSIMGLTGAFDLLELAQNSTALSSIRNTAAQVGGRVAALAGAAATGVMTAAQWALNVAMDANPIGLVVLAVAALVGVFILAYKHSETFRNIISDTFNAILAFPEKIKDFGLKIITSIGNGISAAFNFIKEKIGGIANFLLPSWLTKLLGLSGSSETSIKVNSTTTSSAAAQSTAGVQSAARSASGTTYSTQNIINVPEGTKDPHAFGRRVATGIKDQQRLGAI